MLLEECGSDAEDTVILNNHSSFHMIAREYRSVEDGDSHMSVIPKTVNLYTSHQIITISIQPAAIGTYLSSLTIHKFSLRSNRERSPYFRRNPETYL